MRKWFFSIGVFLVAVWSVTLTPAEPVSVSRPAFSSSTESVAIVSVVIDGDTFELDDRRRVRLIGIDAPERDEPGYRSATNRLRAVVEGKTVRLVSDVSDVDRYGRLLRYVYLDDVFVNELMVREGFAVAVSYKPDVALQVLLDQAEASARADDVGVWRVQ